MNFESLLRRYIRFLLDVEGNDFIDQLDERTFSPEERGWLEGVSKDAWADYFKKENKS